MKTFLYFSNRDLHFKFQLYLLKLKIDFYVSNRNSKYVVEINSRDFWKIFPQKCIYCGSLFF